MSRKDIKDTLNEIHDAGAIKTEIYAEYRKRKLHVQLLEAQNDSKIIVFPSVDAPWYKIGWNSALFYAYDIGIRACSKFYRGSVPLPRVSGYSDKSQSMRFWISMPSMLVVAEVVSKILG